MAERQEIVGMYKRFILIAATVSALIYIGWRAYFTIPFGFGTVAVICGITLLLAEMSDMFENMVSYKNIKKVEFPVKPTIKTEKYPHIDVFITTCNETAELLFKTINGCLHMDYPYKSKVHIYLCDDGNRLEMKELAGQMGINYLAHTDNQDAKAGNLNNALKNSSSPYVATLDADMIPKHNFLMETIPYLMVKEFVGFVQTPQDFYNPDLFQYYLYSERRIPNEQAYFFHYVQLSRNQANAAIYCGSNAIIARKALEDVGGFVTGVLTEDYATGMAIQSKGYISYAINKIVASGLAPVDLKSLIRQRQRWARGCIQSGRKLHFLFRKDLSWGQKIQYMASTTYWYTGVKRFIYITTPILFSVFGVVVLKTSWVAVLIFWLPMYLFGAAKLKMLSQNTRSTRWNNIIETIIFPSLLTSVLLETFYISKRKFEITKKGKEDAGDRTYHLLQAMPHIILSVLSVVGIYICFTMIFNTGSLIYLIVLFWLSVNFYNLVMAIFFMFGRKMFRNNERIRVEVPCKLDDGRRVIDCFTFDLSDTGFSVSNEFPLYIPDNTPSKVSLKTDHYQCDFEAEVVRVVSKGSIIGKQNRWLYAFNITDISEEDKKQYYQIIYDRDFDLPRSLDRHVRVFGDLRINVVQRTQKLLDHNRKLPRVILEKTLATRENNSLILAKFNYDYAEVKTFDQRDFPPNISFIAADNIDIICTYVRIIEVRKKSPKVKPVLLQTTALYKIENKDELAYSKAFQALLDEWINEYDRS